MDMKEKERERKKYKDILHENHGIIMINKQNNLFFFHVDFAK